MTMKLDAATRMVKKAEQRERTKALAALRKWLPMRRAHLALVPVADGAKTDADLAEALCVSWEEEAVREATESAASESDDAGDEVSQ